MVLEFNIPNGAMITQQAVAEIKQLIARWCERYAPGSSVIYSSANEYYHNNSRAIRVTVDHRMGSKLLTVFQLTWAPERAFWLDYRVVSRE